MSFFFGSLACGVVFARGAVLVVPGNALCFDCVNASTLRCEMERVCSTAFGAVRLSALDRHVHGEETTSARGRVGSAGRTLDLFL